MKSHTSILWIISSIVILGVLGVVTPRLLHTQSFSLVDQKSAAASSTDFFVKNNLASSSINQIRKEVAPAHLPTPDAVRGIYMSACVASDVHLRNKVVATIADTAVNTIMIDVKDYTGTVSYADTKVSSLHGRGCIIDDLPEFLIELHERNIYTIARITTFQDPLYARFHSDTAIQSISNKGKPWVDKNGLAYIYPGNHIFWDYVVGLAEEAHAIGFDEINFDYIRFPSDGMMEDADFALTQGTRREDIVESFFAYLHKQLSPQGIIISGDIFGQTTVTRSDMGIGQVLERALPYFDYVMPMVYPSHFIKGFMGYDNPAEYPYEIIRGTMLAALERAAVISVPPQKIRPWLQAFDLGAKYTPDMVHKQVQGVYDAGLTSWILWDAANRYTQAEL